MFSFIPNIIFYSNTRVNFQRIGEAMVGVLASSAVDNGSSLDREKTNTIKLVCVASR